MNMAATLGELFGIPKEEQVEKEVKTHFVDRSCRCQAVQHVGVCGNPITNGGVNGSGFCEECWTVDIVTAHELYHECRKDGMTRDDAIERAMINTKDGVEGDPYSKKHIKVKPRIDFDTDKHIYETMGKADPMFRRVENESSDAS